MPPPSPWMTRPTTSGASVVAMALTNVPTATAVERDHEHALLPEHVAEPAEDRRRDRRAEQERRQHPGHRRRRRAQVGLDLAQGRRYERLRHGQGKPAEREEEERDVVVRTMAEQGLFRDGQLLVRLSCGRSHEGQGYLQGQTSS